MTTIFDYNDEMNLLKFFIVFILFFKLSAEDSPSVEIPLESVTLQLQWKHQFEFAGFYAAKEKGFFADVGLDVTFLELDNNRSIVDEVLENKAQYGLAYSSVVIDYLQGTPLVLLANFFKQSPLVLVVQPEIKTPSDLKGKRVMGVSDSIDVITLLTMLDKFNIKTDDIINVPATFSIDSFVEKKIDAMSGFTTNELYELDKRGVKYTVFDPVVYGLKYYDNNLFTTQKELEEHPKRVENFRAASIRGWKYALSHQAEMIEIIREKYNTQNRSEEALAFEAKQIEFVMLPEVHEVGSVDIERIKLIAESFIQAGFVKQIKNHFFENFIYQHHKNPLNLTPKELLFIKAHPKIVLGSDKGWKPYVITNRDGTVSGYDADVLALINQASGANFVLEVGYWAQMQIRAQKREIDGLSTGGIHEERKQYLNFSDIYISMRKMVITSKENPKKIQTLADLDGKRIAIHGSNLVDVKTAKKFPNATIMMYDSIEEVISSVVTGKADAMFGNGAVFYLANELGMPYLKRSVELNEQLNLAFGVRKDWPEAISIINKALAYIGRYKLLDLQNRWFGEDKATFSNSKFKKLHLTDQEVKYLLQKKRIRVCVDPDWMPFEKIVKGEHIGLAADYMQLISKKVHIPISLVQTQTWKESLQKAESRECDILSMVAKTDDKAHYMNFTLAYVETPLVLATKHDQLFIDDINDYKDKRWGVVRGYAIKSLLEERFPNINIVEIDSISDGLKKVERGSLFGCIGSSVTLSHAIQKEFLGTIAITGRLDEKIKYSIATRNDEPILHHIFEKALLSIDSNVREGLFNKWIKLSHPSQTDYTLVWQILVITFLVLMIIFYRYVLLRREIVKRKKAEEKLQKFTVTLSQKVNEATLDLEEKNLKLIESVYNFEDIFNTTMEMIIIFDGDGTISDINLSGLKMLGYYNKSDLVGTKISKHIYESELPKVYENLRLSEHEPYELILLRRDGSHLHTLKSSRRIVRGGKKVRLLTLMDITEIQQKNSHLIQQSKMAALGEMIENIAHQWRQPLSQVNSAVLLVDGLLEQKGVEDEQIDAKLSEIESLTQYMSTTINDFKDFFIEEKKMVTFVLSDVVDKAVKIARSSLKKDDIKVTLTMDRTLVLVGYPNELQQVVLVLLNNSKEALLSRETVDPEIKIDVKYCGETFCISVNDNAGGIKESILEKVFDPYFTTKHQSQGTGLGLYISKLIVEESMKGHLDVQNSAQGASFRIVLYP